MARTPTSVLLPATVLAGVPPISVEGALVGVGDLLVQAAIIAALVLGSSWLALVVWRERMLRRVSRTVHPADAADLRASVRAVPLLRRSGPTPPADPYARTHRVVVPPLGDGRPGESFWAPAPARLGTALGRDGSRTDAAVTLEEGATLLVVSLGRVGSSWDGHRVEPAAERVRLARAAVEAPRENLGPVDRVDSALGTGWRTTSVWPATGRALTDTHVDQDGWAFIVGVLSTAWHARAVDACDAVLATWRWLPDSPTWWEDQLPAAGPAGPPPPP